MKKLIAVLLACFGLCCHGAQAQSDGFYLAAKGPPAPGIGSQDGKTQFLGVKMDVAARVNWLSSTVNDNTSFSLSLSIPNDPALQPTEYILVVAGTAYRTSSWGRRLADNMIQLEFQIAGEANATEVSRYFNTPVTYLQHPGHRFRVSMIPSRSSFKRGDEITVTLNVTNVGDTPVTIMLDGRDRRGGRNDFFFSAYRAGKALPEVSDRILCADCLSSGVTIKPGSTFKDSVNLAKWFEFPEAGIYEVHASYHLNFPDTGRYPVSSWTEYIGADFSIRID